MGFFLCISFAPKKVYEKIENTAVVKSMGAPRPD